jgi:molybdenum cofactor guanylyltransferase
MVTAGVVLVGGRSSRMGTPKAALEWHGSTLLRRTVGVLDRVVDGPMLVVRASGQSIPELPSDIRVVDDPEPDKGPVVGLGAGLAEARRLGADVALVAATDLPFLHPAYLRRVLHALHTDGDTADLVLPTSAGHPQPLATAYRTALADTLADMAAAGQYRLRALFDRCRTHELDEAALLTDAALTGADPTLESLRNVNSRDDYTAARARPAPHVTVWLAGRPHRLRAATLAKAVEALGISPPVGKDGATPLVEGDELQLD